MTDSEVTQIELVLDRGGSIEGRVLTATGDPAPNVWVNAESQSAKDGASPLAGALSGARRRVLTDLEGRFNLAGLATDQRYTLRAVDPYGAAVVRHEVATGHDVQLRLLATGSIAGVAIDTAGHPVTEFTLRATNPATGSGMTRTVLDGGGRFSISELAPGSIGLSVENSAGDTGEVELDLAPGAQLTDVRVVLARARERDERAPNPPDEKLQ